MRMDKSQRHGLSKALYDIGKLEFAALVIGPIISANPFRLMIFVVGLVLFVVTFGLAVLLSKEGDS